MSGKYFSKNGYFLMHVLLIHQAFVLPQEPGGTRHFELTRSLIQQGEHCTIVASDLNYLTGQSGFSSKRLLTKQSLEGANIIRAFTYPSQHRGFIWRILSFLSFMFTSIIASLTVKRVDLVFGTSPPIFQAVSASLISILKKKPFLLEVRDLWPEFAIDIGILRNSILICLSRWLERFLYARATHIMVNSPAYKAYLVKKGVAKEKISLITNGVDLEMFDPFKTGEKFRKLFKLNGKFTVTYAGALGLANDIPTVLKAANLLQNNKGIHFLLVGDGNNRSNLENLARELRLRNVTFVGSRPKSDMPEILAASDICVATLKDIPMFRTTYPNKVFDYMAAGRAVVLAIDGVIRKVVESASCGIFVPPGNEVALAVSIEQLFRNPQKAREMGLSGRRHVTQHFDRKQQADQFLKLIEQLSKKN